MSQETWLREDSNLGLLSLENYNLISQSKRSSAHGGLAIYLHDKNNFKTMPSPIISEIFEGQFIQISEADIDLLKEKVSVNDFFDMLVASGFFPRITLHTRISNSSATLIDNFMCKLTNKSENCTAGILLSALSDHFPYFISLAHSRISAKMQ